MTLNFLLKVVHPSRHIEIVCRLHNSTASTKRHSCYLARVSVRRAFSVGRGMAPSRSRHDVTDAG